MPYYVTGKDGELYHFKYVKRWKEGDHFKYLYPEDLKKAASNAAKTGLNAAGKAIGTGINKVRNIKPEDIQRKKKEVTAATKKALGYDAKKDLDKANTQVKNAKRHEQSARNEWAKANSEHRKVTRDVEIERGRRKKIRESGKTDPKSGVTTYVSKSKDGTSKKKHLASNKDLMRKDAQKLRPTREKEAQAKTKLKNFEGKTKSAEARRDAALKKYNKTPLGMVSNAKKAISAGSKKASEYGSNKIKDLKASAAKKREEETKKKSKVLRSRKSKTRV